MIMMGMFASSRRCRRKKVESWRWCGEIIREQALQVYKYDILVDSKLMINIIEIARRI